MNKVYTEDDHTFVICAYKESPYLEQCILSILRQEKLGKVIIVTATPNEFIKRVASKYQINLFVNSSGGNIARDWNYGIWKAETSLVTLAHQDDIYMPFYLKEVLENINQSSKPLIVFTDYGEQKKDIEVYNTLLLKVKRMMLLPLKVKSLQNSIWMRRRILSMGSAICCPSVTYVKDNLRLPIFQEGMKSNLDWEAWERLSKEDGTFVYCGKPLMLHRIHEKSTTSEIINNNSRVKEDYIIFCKFWPKWVAKLILTFYKKSEKSNNLKV